MTNTIKIMNTKKFGILSVFLIFILGCSFLASPTATPSLVPPSQTPQSPTAVPPTSTVMPPTQPASLGTIALDFVALMCDAQWMNGYEHLTACPPSNADLSGGYAKLIDPTSEGLPANTPVMLTVVGTTSNAVFFRYPTFNVHAGDRFRATLRCQSASTTCDIDFRLEYYDANGKYHSPFADWHYTAGQSPINEDYDLSSLAGQKVDFVLGIQSNGSGSPQDNGALWIAPVIYRPNP